MRPLAFLLALLAASGCGAVERQLVEAAIADRRDDAGLVATETVVDGRTVAFLEREGDGPTLVLVHGFGASKDAWLAFAAEIPDGPRILVPDLAGHGDTEAGPGGYDALRLGDELGAWLDAAAPGPVHVAGSSMGGNVAARLALDRPEAVRSLTLYDPAGVVPPVPSRRDSLAAAGDFVLIPTTRDAFDRLIALSFVEEPDIPGPARDVLAEDYARREPFLRSLLAGLGRDPDNVRPRLGEIAAPTLLVWGAEDHVIHVSAASVWEAGLPDVTVQILPNVGHAPMMERPAETAADFLSFVRQHDSP
ncbi:MAG: alpha/beta fold hydrolase [Bacteroidota bacterium]